MAIIQGNAKQGSTRGFYPKVINGSLRFNDDDSAYLSWTPASAGNRKTWTWSGWVKLGNLTINRTLMAARIGTNNEDTLQILLTSSDKFNIGGYSYGLNGDPLLRDPSAWYHIVIAYDTTQTTDSNRIKTYINGTQITLVGTFPPLNLNGAINNTQEHNIGRRPTVNDRYLDAYLANVHFIDGQALTASDFGETKNGVWVAKDYAGTFGTNGFYLTFEDDTQVEAFNTVLYKSTNGVGGSVTGVGFKPDLIWVKSRSGVRSHVISDSVRGPNANLFPDLTNAESTASTGIQSFDSDGFTYGTTAPLSDGNLVAWCWKAGDSNVSNTDGTITSTVRANDTYGFSIVSYTGDANASKTIGHGLSTAPDMIIVKGRNVAQNWVVYHSANTGSPETQRLYLDGTNATDTVAWWNNTAPTSSVFSVSNFGGTGGAYNYIAYCWSETTGYSKFGSYTANNSTNGPEVDCGFKPAFVMVKHTTKAEQWIIFDATRETTNDRSARLFPAISNAESNIPNDQGIRFLSTAEGDSISGFKITVAGGYGINDNDVGDQYIYAAFADTREAAFWLDQSGNDNDWQPVNLDHNDTVADSPTNNFATMNPLQVATSGAPTFSDGNLQVSTPVSGAGNAVSTIGVTSGKYYAEMTIKSLATLNRANVGITGDASATITANTNIGSLTSGLDVGYFYNGTSFTNNVETAGYGDSYGVGDVIGVALNADDSQVTFYKNGVSQGAISFTSGGTYHFAVGDVSAGGGNTFECNFGQQPFKYDPPA